MRNLFISFAFVTTISCGLQASTQTGNMANFVVNSADVVSVYKSSNYRDDLYHTVKAYTGTLKDGRTITCRTYYTDSSATDRSCKLTTPNGTVAVSNENWHVLKDAYKGR